MATPYEAWIKTGSEPGAVILYSAHDLACVQYAAFAPEGDDWGTLYAMCIGTQHDFELVAHVLLDRTLQIVYVTDLLWDFYDDGLTQPGDEDTRVVLNGRMRSFRRVIRADPGQRTRQLHALAIEQLFGPGWHLSMGLPPRRIVRMVRAERKLLGDDGGREALEALLEARCSWWPQLPDLLDRKMERADMERMHSAVAPNLSPRRTWSRRLDLLWGRIAV